MATDDDTPVDPDTFAEPAVENDTRDDVLDLDAGEEYIGKITGYKPWVGDYGLLLIDGEELWLNKTMQGQLIAGLVEDRDVMYRKSEDTESFENEDGEEQTYNPRSLLFMED